MLEIMFENTVIATVLAFLVLVVCWLLRPRPSIRFALWGIVVIKMVSPIGLFWKLPLPFEIPAVQILAHEPPADSGDKGEALSAEIRPELNLKYEIAELHDLSSPLDLVKPEEGIMIVKLDRTDEAPTLVAPSTQVSDPMPRIAGWQYLAGAIWAVGSFFLIWRIYRQIQRLSLWASAGRHASNSLVRRVSMLAQKIYVRTPEVRVLPNLSTPMMWCLFRPQLLWPKGLQDELNHQERDAIILHELAHIRRRDHWWRWLETLATIIYWWNPIFWYARRQMRLHAEFACDAWVTSIAPESRRAYAEAILSVCERRLRGNSLAPAVGLGGDSRHDFQRRLQMIICSQSPARLTMWARLLMVALAVSVLPAWSIAQPESEAKKPVVKPFTLSDFHFLIEDGERPSGKFFFKTVGKEEPKKDGEQPSGTFFFKAIGKGDPKIDLPPMGKAADPIKQIDETIAHLTKEIEALKVKRKLIEAHKELMSTVPHWIQEAHRLPGPTHLKIIGPDGKEIVGAKIVINDHMIGNPNSKNLPGGPILGIRLNSGADNTIRVTAVPDVHDKPSIALTRSSYRLTKDKADALVQFMRASVKNEIFESNYDSGRLTITTTPDLQKSIAGLLSQLGHKETLTLELHGSFPMFPKKDTGK